MIISDLNHCQDVKEATNLVGGSGFFSITDLKNQYSSVYQSGYSSAKAASQFGGATAVATVVNTATVIQEI